MTLQVRIKPDLIFLLCRQSDYLDSRFSILLGIISCINVQHSQSRSVECSSIRIIAKILHEKRRLKAYLVVGDLQISRLKADTIEATFLFASENLYFVSVFQRFGKSYPNFPYRGAFEIERVLSIRNVNITFAHSFHIIFSFLVKPVFQGKPANLSRLIARSKRAS